MKPNNTPKRIILQCIIAALELKVLGETFPVFFRVDINPIRLIYESFLHSFRILCCVSALFPFPKDSVQKVAD